MSDHVANLRRGYVLMTAWLVVLLAAVEARAVDKIRAGLVRRIDTSQWAPPSTDPAGIVFVPETGNFLVCDSEIDEIPFRFTGMNVFEVSGGNLVNTYSTIAFSREPTGVSVNP